MSCCCSLCDVRTSVRCFTAERFPFSRSSNEIIHFPWKRGGRPSCTSGQRVIKPRPRSGPFLLRLSVSDQPFLSFILPFIRSLFCRFPRHTLPVSGKLAVANVIKEKAFLLFLQQASCLHQPCSINCNMLISQVCTGERLPTTVSVTQHSGCL